MQALSHFSYHHSNGECLLCDLQGGRYEDCFVLTDPVVMSRSRTYGVTDLGFAGISNFFAHHKCNRYCKASWKKVNGPLVHPRIPVQMGTSMSIAALTPVKPERPPVPNGW